MHWLKEKKKDKQLVNKHYTDNYILSNTNLLCERSELFMVKNVYLGFFDKFNLLQSSHTDGNIFFLHIAITLHVTHLHTLLMHIFLT